MELPRRDVATDLGLVLLAVIWGVNVSVLRFVLREVEPLAVNALRFPLAAVALWFLVRRLPGPLAPDREDLPRIVGLGILGHVLYQLMFIFGLNWTLAGNASLLLATSPVWTVIFSTARGHERADLRVLAGVVGTLAGVSLVILGSANGIEVGSQTLRGDLLILLSAALWASYTVGGRSPVRRYGPLRITAWTLWVGTPPMVLLGLPSLLRTDLREVSLGAWLGIAYAGLFAITIAYLLWYRGVQRLGNNRTAVYSNLVPVAALLTAWAWLGEAPTALQLVGAAVILGGLTLARLARSPDPTHADGATPGTRSRSHPPERSPTEP